MKTTIFRMLLRTLAPVMACVPLVAASMPILQVKNDILIGAKNVVVNEQNYDVTFTGGSCTEAFGTCGLSSFYFRDFETAQAASQALVDQVFVNGSAGMFDKDSSLTNGCQTYASYCNVLTPVAMDGSVVIGATAMNYSGGARSEIVQKFYRYADDAWPNLSYARWMPALAEVPEPNSVALIGIAFATMSLFRRRR
ncbi:PEP-CTERM sorting domain-containing protein [Massilia sp.]|uniref:PEP-CTERM sorting domain-containing protein n=1 Tax=Massilia sp. TaxID=1882437 RepID=UPI00352EDA57